MPLLAFFAPLLKKPAVWGAIVGIVLIVAGYVWLVPKFHGWTQSRAAQKEIGASIADIDKLNVARAKDAKAIKKLSKEIADLRAQAAASTAKAEDLGKQAATTEAERAKLAKVRSLSEAKEALDALRK